jgi:hypothetical protein
MSRRRRSHYRPSLGWNLGVAFEGTLTRLRWPVQEFTCVRCCGSPRASSPHGLAAPASRVSRRTMLRAVASGSRLLPTRPVKDLHLQSSAHAGHTFRRYAALRASSLGAASPQPKGWSTLRRRSWSILRSRLTRWNKGTRPALWSRPHLIMRQTEQHLSWLWWITCGREAARRFYNPSTRKVFPNPKVANRANRS